MAHDEGAVKQFLYEKELIKPGMLLAPSATTTTGRSKGKRKSKGGARGLDDK
jgi:hypothetical protein